MKLYSFLLIAFLGCSQVYAQTSLKVVLIRHGEKPLKGDNLTCQGLNRALALPRVITQKFGVPQSVFVPALALGDSTKHARMFETVIPLVSKYNLRINSSHSEKDSTAIAEDIKGRSGVVLVVWEHKALVSIVHALGIQQSLHWPDMDYDSIWVINWTNGKPVLTLEKENINPGSGCNF